ncbi:MAG: hypothetical protein R3C44_05430 [Chloroflexota bacterium]
MSESDLYRKQRVAIENVAKTIVNMERVVLEENGSELDESFPEAEPSTVT